VQQAPKGRKVRDFITGATGSRVPPVIRNTTFRMLPDSPAAAKKEHAALPGEPSADQAAFQQDMRGICS